MERTRKDSAQGSENFRIAVALVTRSTCVVVRGSFSASRGMRLAFGTSSPAMARILIVDDETNYRVVLRACLERAGHEVLELARGAEVLELACSRKLDAILLDFDLPDGSGTDVCRSLKANAATSCIPVIMVTGRTGEQDRVACFEAGADDLVGKPFSLRELLLRLRVLVQCRGIEPQQVAPQRIRQSGKGATY